MKSILWTNIFVDNRYFFNYFSKWYSQFWFFFKRTSNPLGAPCREGTPRILLESASMAKPIVTTDNVGCRDVVDDGVNGYLCEVRNAQDLADKMEMMLGLSDNERIEMGKRGREKMISEFDESIVIGKYLDSLEMVLK